MVTILCSACLLGVNCKYNGKASPNERVLQLGKKGVTTALLKRNGIKCMSQEEL